MQKSILQLGVLCISLLVTANQLSAQWTKTAGPPGMSVNAFYQAGNNLFAGTASQGVFKSTNHGVSWSAARTGIENREVYSLCSDQTYLYAGTDQGVYRSSDNGATWSAANSGINNKFVTALYVVNGYVFAGTSFSGFFKSANQGATWTSADGTNTLSDQWILAIGYASPNLLVYGTNTIYYSSNNGTTWTHNNSAPYSFSYASAFIVEGDSVLFNGTTGVYRSFDAGKTWSSIITVNPKVLLSGMLRTGKIIYAGSDSGMFQSKNFGTSWKKISTSSLRTTSNLQNNSNCFCKSGNNFLLGYTAIGVAYSSDIGKTWTYTLSGFTPASIISAAMFFSGDTLLAGTYGDGLYQTTDAGTSWQRCGTNILDSIASASVRSVIKAGNIILAGACGQGLFRSADNGATWSHITKGLPIEGGWSCMVSLAHIGKTFLLGTEVGIYMSKDQGVSWSPTSIAGDSYEGYVAANDSIAVATVASLSGSNKIYRSTDYGRTWTSVFSYSDYPFNIVSDGQSHFYLGTDGKNYRSADNGKTWTTFGSGLAGGYTYTLAAQDSNVFVGNADGVYFSNDYGASFTEQSQGFDPYPNNAVQGLAISGGYVYAGTDGDAVWKRPISDFSNGNRLYVALNSLATVYLYPNPLSNIATLHYHLDQSSLVQISIYDFLGRRIRMLKDETEAAGDYQTTISDLPEGNYVALILTGNQQQSIKFEVIR